MVRTGFGLRRIVTAWFVLLLGLALAACGGHHHDHGDGEAPSITAQPADRSVVEGSAASFSASATGVPAPTVRWQVSTDGGSTFADIAGANATAYTLAAPALADNGKRFRAVFANASGSATSSAAMLTVTAAPSGSAVLSLLAGDIGGPGNLDGTGTAARLNVPFAAAVDSAGNAYVTELLGCTIRKVTAAGVVSTFAGASGQCGRADGTGSAARFSSPSGITIDPATGDLYVSDTGNAIIRKVTAAGVVTTVAGDGTAGAADGAAATAQFVTPYGIVWDPAGRLFVADASNDTIRRVVPGVSVSTVAGLANAAGSDDGTGAAARFQLPLAIAIDAAGTLYVADTFNHTIRKLTQAGVVTTVAGSPGLIGNDDGTGAAATFRYPRSIAVDASGTLHVGTTANTVRAISPAGVVTTEVGAAFQPGSADGTGAAAQIDYPSGLTLQADGSLLMVDTQDNTLRRIAAGGVVTTLVGKAPLIGVTDGTGAAARFDLPLGLAADGGGGVVVADYQNSTIRRVSATGVVTSLAGDGFAGYIDATGSAAEFSRPAGVATDSAGNVYVADTDNQVIRKVTPAGLVTTLAGTVGVTGRADGTGAAATFNHPVGSSTDAAGNVYVADQYNNVIRRVTPAGVVTTLAGGAAGFGDGTGDAALFSQPTSTAVDAAGNVYVVDYGNQAIRKITPAGVVTTVAGQVAGSADGTGGAASFRLPQALCAEPSGTLYVSDTGNHTVRKVTPAGVVTTVLGVAGQRGIRLGSDPRLDSPLGIACLGSGRIAVASANAVLTATLP